MDKDGIVIVDGGFMVFGDDSFGIYRGTPDNFDPEDGEIVYWTEQEWVDDPQVLFPIVNAATLAAQEGVEAVARKIGK
jgi:hypothetical protein